MTNRVVHHRLIYDPGMQQEPQLYRNAEFVLTNNTSIVKYCVGNKEDSAHVLYCGDLQDPTGSTK